MDKFIILAWALLALGLGVDAYNTGVKGDRYSGGGQSFGGGIQTLPGSIGGGHGGGIQTLPGSIGGGHGGGIQTLPGSIGGGHGGGIQTLPARLPGGTSGYPGASRPHQTRPLPRPGKGSGSRYTRPVRPGYGGSKGGSY